MTRAGSLAPIAGRHGVNAWLYVTLGQPRQRRLHVHRRSAHDRAQRRPLAAPALDEPLVFPSARRHRVLLLRDPDGRGRQPAQHPDRPLHEGGTGWPRSGCSCSGLGSHHGERARFGFTAGPRRGGGAVGGLHGGILRLLRAAHPPAGATTVIVSVGLLTTVSQLAILLSGVLLLSAAAWSLNRALGVPAPLWTGAK